MSLSALDQNHCRVLMFGGKGGVGKTTTCATTASLAQQGQRTLIISSDLTLRWRTSLRSNRGHETSIPGVPNLTAGDRSHEVSAAGRSILPEIYEGQHRFFVYAL